MDEENPFGYLANLLLDIEKPFCDIKYRILEIENQIMDEEKPFGYIANLLLDIESTFFNMEYQLFDIGKLF